MVTLVGIFSSKKNSLHSLFLICPGENDFCLNHSDEARKDDIFQLPHQNQFKILFWIDVSYYDEILKGYNLFDLWF